jgi:SAM-dependent methyltransferase
VSGERSPLYDDPVLAASYARVSAANVCNAAYERPAMRALAGDVRDLDVLDAGCAAGEQAASLTRSGARVVALDASEAMVALARERLGTGVCVVQHDLAVALPFADASFDLVLSSLTLHYLEDWSVPLRQFARVLRPRGRLLFSTHHPYLTLGERDYHQVRRVDELWNGFAAEPVAVRFFHRPLERIVGDVLAAGFTLRGVHEPQPTVEAHRRDPELAQGLRTRPWFLLVDALRR